MEFDVKFRNEESGEEHYLEVFGIHDDENEVFFDKLGEFIHEGRVYWICQEIFLDEERSKVVGRGDFRVLEMVEIDGDEYLNYVDDGVEREILEIWEESVSGDQL